jgi:ABC-2 type transport system permease protein
MSTSDLVAGGRQAPAGRQGPASAAASPTVRRPGSDLGRLVRSELRLVFGRRRNIALLGVLACAPILLATAIRIADGGGGGGSGRGPAFIGQITNNGLFVAFTSIVVLLPLFFPLAVSVVAGESVAGEASTGTLRNLLVVPVGRTRVLVVKFAGILAYTLASVAVVAGVGVLVGLLLFPIGPVQLLSGGTIPAGTALVRVLLVALYVTAMLAAVAALGLFFSTLTEVPMAAMAATAVATVVVGILQVIPQISAIHPYLFSHWWLAFGDLLRDPVQVDRMTQGLLVSLAYVTVFGLLAWARLTTKDVTS